MFQGCKKEQGGEGRWKKEGARVVSEPLLLLEAGPSADGSRLRLKAGYQPAAASGGENKRMVGGGDGQE